MSIQLLHWLIGGGSCGAIYAALRGTYWKQRLEEYKTEFERERQFYRSTIESLEARFHEHEALLDGYRSQSREKIAELEQARNALVNSQRQLAAYEGEKRLLQTEIDQLRDQVSAQQNTIAGQQKEIGHLRRQLQALGRKVTRSNSTEPRA